MKASDLVTEFQRYFNSRFAQNPSKNPISASELAILYIFCKWLDRKYLLETKKKPAK